ncbi:MAG TPA: hypothetical protein VF313_12670 [Anaerolineaceae bacterium]
MANNFASSTAWGNNPKLDGPSTQSTATAWHAARSGWLGRGCGSSSGADWLSFTLGFGAGSGKLRL